ncbi:hypothetical protein HK103_003295 [Boothiomyces macroporosus]|uniref:methionine--tRNA ligase n=1 Tax=Boothiomyces macroporosus TaxID=261099 RepID=A0AAD5Y033_9FUNG|nr:hypothetical protein HK103_003295 [Boothiomyces macroporosus]
MKKQILQQVYGVQSELSAHALAKKLTKNDFEIQFIEMDFCGLDLDLLEKQISKVSGPAKYLIYVSLKDLNVSGYPNIQKFMKLLETEPAIKQLKSSVTIKLDHHERIVLPEKNKKNILITSALPSVNNIPHLGNIIGCVLSADVYARYCRIRGYNAIYICGSDEYGTTTETKAIEEGLTFKQLSDKYHTLHAQTYSWFQIDFDIYGRTATPQQTEITQDIYKKLDKNGHIFEDKITQLFCEKHQSFLADRYVEGTCPFCGYEDARGDQCDACGKLIDAIELIKPHCKLDGATPVPKESKHMFLDLKEQQPALEKWYKKASLDGNWSANSQTITSSWLKEGLRPRCITRDLKWGTAIPREGYEHKVFYVWFDAPIGYPSITANYSKDWEKWWKNPENVKLYQFMGKDNVPFHTVMFPSTLLGTKDNWTMLHHLSTTEYLQYENTKFSKSRGVGVFGNNVMESGIPVEVWRYYLLSLRPESSDAQFTWAGFQAANNNELLANLGNFINRVVKFVNSKYKNVIPEYTPEEPEQELVKEVNDLLQQYINALENVKLRLGLKLVMDIATKGNTYLQSNKIDNTLFTNNKKRCDTVVATALNLSYLLSALIYPYMPSTTEGILRQLNLSHRKITDTWENNELFPGHTINKAEYLFSRIEDAKIEQLREMYSGKQKGGAADASANTKEKKKKKKSSAPAAVVPENMNADQKAVHDKITQQGEVVRKLKAENADASAIKSAVDELLSLKKQFSELTI